MSPTHLAKIWSVLGPVTALLSLIAISQSQGGPVISGAFLIEARPAIASYFFVFVLSAFLFTLCLIASLYASQVGEQVPWSGRLPVFADDPAHPSDVQARSTKLYQAFFLVTFVFLPAYAVGHLDRVVLNQAVIWNEKAGAANAIAVKYSVFEGNPDEQRRAAATLSPDSAGEHPQLWLADRFYDPQREQDVNFKTNNPRDLSPPCEEHRRACRGVQWFHPGSLIALAVMSGLAGAIVLFLLFTLFRPSGAGQT